MEPKLYKVDVGSSVYGGGVGLLDLYGTPITVEGTPMVKLAHGAIVPAKGWHADQAAANAEAADHIEGLAKNLLEQAQRLRMKSAIIREGVSL